MINEHVKQSNELVIEAGRLEKNYWRDLWGYRELFYFLAWRDTLVRYKQTAIGIAWAILRPLFTMLVLTLVFGKLAKLPSDGAPYAITVFAAILPWQFFSSAFSEAGNSLVANAGMLSKIYFPRLIIPISAVITAFVDFLISALLLALLLVIYSHPLSWRILTLPIFIILAFAAAMGFGIWVAALNVAYRDFGYVVPFVIQLGLYISPVGFSSSLVPDQWRLLYSINPMVSVIDGFRWAIIGGEAKLYLPGFMLSATMVFFVLITGLMHFRKTEKKFADLV